MVKICIILFKILRILNGRVLISHSLSTHWAVSAVTGSNFPDLMRVNIFSQMFYILILISQKRVRLRSVLTLFWRTYGKISYPGNPSWIESKCLVSERTRTGRGRGRAGVRGTCSSNGTRIVPRAARTHYVTPFFLLEWLASTLPIGSLVTITSPIRFQPFLFKEINAEPV